MMRDLIGAAPRDVLTACLLLLAPGHPSCERLSEYHIWHEFQELSTLICNTLKRKEYTF
jgi:hypothetical protein